MQHVRVCYKKNVKPMLLTHMSRKNLKNYRMLKFIFKTGDLII
jgi:hypothetical protein